MPYLIDGHNVIAALPDLGLDDENDEAKLVLKLRGFAARAKTKCTVIFDSGLPAGASSLSTGAVKVVFASGQSSADAVIGRRISQIRDAGNWTLVSSDREIVGHARRQGMRLLSSAEFARRLRGDDGRKHQAAPLPSGPEKPNPSDDDTDHWLKQFGAADDDEARN